MSAEGVRPDDDCCSPVQQNGPQLTKGFAHALGRYACRLVGHRFVEFADGFKRRCDRCNREEWVFSNPYPLIGQPKYEWRHMPFDWPRFRSSSRAGRAALTAETGGRNEGS